MDISHETPINIFSRDSFEKEADSDSIADWPLSQLRICFPTKITINDSQGNTLVFEDCPILGFVCDLSQLLEEILIGSNVSEVNDFYGEYQLKLSHIEEGILLERVDDGDSVGGSLKDFKNMCKAWFAQVLEDLENTHQDLLSNTHFNELKLKIC